MIILIRCASVLVTINALESRILLGNDLAFAIHMSSSTVALTQPSRPNRNCHPPKKTYDDAGDD